MKVYNSWRKGCVYDIPIIRSISIYECAKRTKVYLDDMYWRNVSPKNFVVIDIDTNETVFDSEFDKLEDFKPSPPPPFLYKQDGLKAALDNDSVTLYLFGAQLVEMTTAEFKEMAGVVLAKMEEVGDEA